MNANRSTALALTINEAAGLILLRAWRRQIPITLVEITTCIRAFADLNHPNLTVNSADEPLRADLGGWYFNGLRQFVGALEEFGYSERLGSYTLLYHQGPETVTDWCAHLLTWRSRPPVHRRAISRFNHWTDRYLAQLRPRTRDYVAPPPSIVQTLLVSHVM